MYKISQQCSDNNDRRPTAPCERHTMPKWMTLTLEAKGWLSSPVDGPSADMREQAEMEE